MIVGSPVKQQGFRSPCEPSYSRSHFDNVMKPDAGKPAAKNKEDFFGDLLGSQGYSFTSSKNACGPKTINEMRKVEMVKEMDPNKAKVMPNS
jgi:cyclin G-associated kinase